MSSNIKLILVFVLAILITGGFVIKHTTNVPEEFTPVQSEQLRNLNVKAGDTISSTFVLTGEARLWYFEGSFPVSVLDAHGNVLVNHYAQAQGEWMTTEFVPFESTLSFTPTTEKGFLLLKKDNPSDLPEHDEEVRIPIRFGPTVTDQVTLFYQNPNLSSLSDPLCSPTSIFPVAARIIPHTKSPIKDTLQLLIKGELTQAEKDAGFQTEFPQEGFMLKGVNLKDGVLTIEFNEVPGFTSGGSCRVTILREQIERTAKQFKEVREVVIIPAEIFQP